MQIDETLTASERSAPFQIGEGADDAPSKPTRQPTITDGDGVHVVDLVRGTYTTIDPTTGRKIRSGQLGDFERAA